MSRIVVFVLLCAGCARQPHPAPLPTSPYWLWVGGDVHLADTRWSMDLGLSEPGFVNLEGIIRTQGPWSVIDEAERRVELYHSPEAVASMKPAVRFLGVANNHSSGSVDGFVSVDGLVTQPDFQIAQFHIPGEVDLAGADTSAPLLVAFHVTDPQPSYLPNDQLESAIQVAVDAGAELVVAHGTHLVGPVQVIGETVVVTGLGNLVFNCACTTETDALIVRWGPNRVELVPIRAGLNGASPIRDDSVLELLEALGTDPEFLAAHTGRR